jgi:RimJ/RimL family protein N-acetyltransferase
MNSERHSPEFRLRLWADADLDLLRLINSPEMTEHLGGPETEQQLLARHQRYLRGTAESIFWMFVIELGTPAGPEAAGSIGYWPLAWNGADVYETGWSVLPAHQGKGLATAAARRLTQHAAERGDRQDLHAFPMIGNPASNAICAKAGFRLLGEAGFEYPKGHPIRVNDWWLNLAELG